MDNILKVISLISNLFTIIASGIAIYIFVVKRDKISSVFKLLLNYSSQITLSELKAKLERLNDLNANESSQKDEVVNTLNEIIGQIRGNKKLSDQCKGILGRTTSLVKYPRKLTEPKKRALVSELREYLRHVNLANFDELIGGDK